MSTQVEVAQAVGIIGSAYPNYSPTKETVSVYYELLKDVPFDLLRVATMQCCAEIGRKFAPSVGEILGAVAEIKRQVDGIPSQFEAWEDLIKAGRGLKRYQQKIDGEDFIVEERYKFLHPLVKTVAEQLGWPDRFPGSSSDEMADRAHYYKAYESALSKHLRGEVTPTAVKAYIQEKQSPLLAMGNLTKRLEKK